MERAGGMVGRLMEGGWCREDMLVLGFPKDAPGGQITGVGRRKEGSRRKRSSFGKEERRLRWEDSVLIWCWFIYLLCVEMFVWEFFSKFSKPLIMKSPPRC